MQNIPPKTEKIVIIRKFDKDNKRIRELNVIKFNRDLWEEMEFQMEDIEVDLSTFISQACKLYVDSLKREEATNLTYLYLSEFQQSSIDKTPPIPTNPIPINPVQPWYYHVYNDAQKLEEEGK